MYSTAPSKSVSDWIDDLGVGWAQYRTLLVGGGAWLISGSILFVLSGTIKLVAHNPPSWDLNVYEQGLLVAVVFAGVLFGNVSSGLVGDTLGRKGPVIACYL